jgi:uncharacterized membrane protein
MVDPDEARESVELRAYNSERAKAFIDAVVAIAMTLLILPLMEGVTETAGKHGSGADWLDEHQAQLFSFVLSFLIIAMFWINHHRLFSSVEKVSVPLLWITMAWLLSIVWIPVATALSGQMGSGDWVVKTLYIGSMILTSLLMLAMRTYLVRHPALHVATPFELRRGMAVDIAMALLFAIALILSLSFEVLGYWSLFIMAFSGPVQELIARTLGAGKDRDPRRAGKA